MDSNGFQNIRIFFSKRGDARFISHLDLTRCMQRSIKRAGLPIWYTQGFHPHQYMTFALPLALGYESLCESMDIRLVSPMDGEQIKERLNGALPRDIRVLRVGEQGMDPKEIAWAQYDVRVLFSGEETPRKWEELLSQDEIIVSKKTKKGTKDIDIRPMVTVLSTGEEEGFLTLTLRLPAGNTQNLNPTLLFEAYCKTYAAELLAYDVLRTHIFTVNFHEFL